MTENVLKLTRIVWLWGNPPVIETEFNEYVLEGFPFHLEYRTSSFFY